jgi:hypothetical protein
MPDKITLIDGTILEKSGNQIIQTYTSPQKAESVFNNMVLSFTRVKLINRSD